MKIKYSHRVFIFFVGKRSYQVSVYKQAKKTHFIINHNNKVLITVRVKGKKPSKASAKEVLRTYLKKEQE